MYAYSAALDQIVTVFVPLAFTTIRNNMAVPPPNAPAMFYLYAAVPKSRKAEYIDRNLLFRDEGWYHIGLRQTYEGAMWRAQTLDDGVSKHSYDILEVMFTPLGTAYYTTTLTDASYKYMPLLHKVWKGAGDDQGNWHFNGDLPLFLCDVQGNVLVTSQWREIS